MGRRSEAAETSSVAAQAKADTKTIDDEIRAEKNLWYVGGGVGFLGPRALLLAFDTLDGGASHETTRRRKRRRVRKLE